MKKVLIIFSIIGFYSFLCKSETPPANTQCDNTLQDCIKYSQSLQNQNTILQSQVTELQKERDKAVTEAKSGSGLLSFLGLGKIWDFLVAGGAGVAVGFLIAH